MVAMNERKKKCVGLQRIWVSKRTVVPQSVPFNNGQLFYWRWSASIPCRTGFWVLLINPQPCFVPPYIRMAQWPKTPCLREALLSQSACGRLNRDVSCLVLPCSLARLFVNVRCLGSTTWRKPMVERPATPVHLHGCWLAGWLTLLFDAIHSRPNRVRAHCWECARITKANSSDWCSEYSVGDWAVIPLHWALA